MTSENKEARLAGSTARQAMGADFAGHVPTAGFITVWAKAIFL